MMEAGHESVSRETPNRYCCPLCGHLTGVGQCTDPVACINRRAAQAVKRAAEPRPVPEIPEKTGRGAPAKPPRTLERHELPFEVERHAKATERLEKDLAKPDKRPVCPMHGPKNTVAIEGKAERRFVCCGRVQEV